MEDRIIDILALQTDDQDSLTWLTLSISSSCLCCDHTPLNKKSKSIFNSGDLKLGSINQKWLVQYPKLMFLNSNEAYVLKLNNCILLLSKNDLDWTLKALAQVRASQALVDSG